MIPEPSSTTAQTVSAGRFISPFNLTVDPIDRLLLTTFEQDPDTIYTTFEFQVFTGPPTGHGWLILAARRDGRVDVYHQPGLSMDHKDLNIVMSGVAHQIACDITDTRFDVTPDGLQFDCRFEDYQGRQIAIHLHEKARRPRKPFALLAPLGSATVDPPALPLILLYDFYLVRRKNTEVAITIDGHSHTPDSLPLPVDGSRMLLTRYATDTLPATWNPRHDGPLTPLPVDSANRAHDGDVVYDLLPQADGYALQTMSIATDQHRILITFDAPLPDLRHVTGTHQGRFTIDCESAAGFITGTYQVSRQGDEVRLHLHPAGGWHPGVRRLSMRLMFLFAPMFKRWAISYHWHATLDLSHPAAPSLQSHWTRDH